MTYPKTPSRLAALLVTVAVLSACAPPQENVYYDPWQEYELGRVYDCDEGWPDMRHNTENSAWTGFGCSHQSNVSLMVADPADLQRPRAMTPGDPQARQRVLEDYREGKDTSTAPDAKGTEELIN